MGNRFVLAMGLVNGSSRSRTAKTEGAGDNPLTPAPIFLLPA